MRNRISNSKRWCKSWLLAAALQAVAGVAQAGNIHWEAVQLPNLAGLGERQTLNVTAINNAGQVVGVATNLADGSHRAFLYSGGQMVGLGSVSPANQGWVPTAISDPVGLQGSIYIGGNVNNVGSLYGRSAFVQQARTAGLPRIGAFQEFSVPGSARMSVVGVNQGGILVGTYDTMGDSLRAFTWSADRGLFTLQSGDPWNRGSSASAINNAGMVVGDISTGYHLGAAALWNGQTGAVQNIGALPGGVRSTAYALNEQGVVVGASNDDSGRYSENHAFLYQNGVMHRIADGLETQGSSVASSINNRGQVLGRFDAGSGEEKIFIYTASGGAVSLAGLGLGFGDGMRINDYGQIQGYRANLSDGLLFNPAGTLSWAKTTGGSVGVADNWDSGMGFTPNRFLDVVIGSSRFQTIDADVSFEAKSLRIEGSLLGRTTLALSNGAVINALEGVRVGSSGYLQGAGRILGPAVQNYGVVLAMPGQFLQMDGGIDNHGLITGNGRIEANVINRGGGATGIQVGAGQHLTLAGTAHSMADASHIRIQDGGTLAFEGRLINQGGATVEIQRGVLQVDYGANAMQNGGHILVGSGRAEILGNVYNNQRGLIHAQDGADLTIWDGLVNDGEARVSGGARIVYAGAVSGKGSFTGLEGMHRFEGGYSPGASPAEVQMGNVQFASLVTMELGGLSPGSQHDRIVFSGSVLFEEISFLQIDLINGFTPHAGDHFALFSYVQAPVGSFEDFYLPSLTQGLSWDVSQLHSTGVLWVSGVPEPQTWALMGLGLACLFRLRPGRQIT